MPTSLAGKANNGARGVTLLELMVVVAIIALMAGISFPAITSGLDSIRLSGAAQNVVTFLNTGLARAERRQQVVEITISQTENSLTMRSSEPSFVRRLDLPEGVTIQKIVPELPEGAEGPRIFMLYPGGTVPPIGVLLENRRKVMRFVEVDPMTGVPLVKANHET